MYLHFKQQFATYLKPPAAELAEKRKVNPSNFSYRNIGLTDRATFL